jgi:glutamate-1-semialdehyde 2,1-aminomutase
MKNRNMRESDSLFERAMELMPWGTQTNSKRPDPAYTCMPLFIERAEGCRVRDVEGFWYIDFRSALGPIILGYCHPAVDEAVREQMGRGVLFSMASPLEIEVAERLTRLPGIEQVHFMKTGNEANAAAVRLARGFTERDHIVTCGYHGHGDWFACGTGGAPLWSSREGNGVPALLDRLVSRVAYGDSAELGRIFEEKGSSIAAVIMVPYDWNDDVASGFVEQGRSLTRQYGALLIFDQVLTGFRLAAGGAQEYFGVEPDLSTYAKALANGYPLSAFGGRRDVMEVLYRATITSTYAGETLSLAAARATLDTIWNEPVIEHIWEMGTRLKNGFDRAARERGIDATTFGLPPAVQFRFGHREAPNEAAHTLFFRELFERGIFAARPFLLSYAHDTAAIDETLQAMGDALDVVASMPILDR